MALDVHLNGIVPKPKDFAHLLGELEAVTLTSQP